MSWLSSAIFEWDEEDYELLTSVKATPIDYSSLQTCTGVLVDQHTSKAFTCTLQGYNHHRIELMSHPCVTLFC